MRAEAEGSFLQTGKPWVRERRKRKHQGVVCVRAHACKLRQCNKDPSASLGMTIRGSVWAQMGGAPSFLLGDAQKWLSVTSHQSLATSHSYSLFKYTSFMTYIYPPLAKVTFSALISLVSLSVKWIFDSSPARSR